MKLLIVIVNYRSADLTIDCLRSLEPEISGHSDIHVVITDNNSGDDSVPRLSTSLQSNHWQTWATLMPLPHNGGFAYGNNAAIRPALSSTDKPQYVLLLNPDTLVRPGAIAAMLGFLDSHPKIGIIGSRLEDLDGTPQRSAFRFHSIRSELETSWRIGRLSAALRRHIVAPPPPAEQTPTDWVAGASMMIRMQVLNNIGLLDEDYFMYFEEVDFCLRARRAGWPCWYVPEARVVHLVGQSSGVTDAKRAAKRRPAYWFASRRRYFKKNHGRLIQLLADLAWASGFALFRLRQVLFKTPSDDPPHLLWDFVRYNFLAIKP